MRHLRQPAQCRRLSLGRGRPERTRLPGEHGISRKATAQGRPSDLATPVCCCAVFLRVLLRSGPRVPAGTRPSLRPLGSRGWSDQAKLGRNAPRDREGVSASTRSLSSPGLTGRSSIPVAVVFEPRRHSVLDSPPSRGMTMVLGGRRHCLLLRHCERSEAIQTVTAEGFWIASLRSQ